MFFTSKTESDDVNTVEGDESVLVQEIEVIGDELTDTGNPIGSSKVVDGSGTLGPVDQQNL